MLQVPDFLFLTQDLAEQISYQENTFDQNESYVLSDLVRIALDRDEPLPSLRPHELESVLYGFNVPRMVTTSA